MFVFRSVCSLHSLNGHSLRLLLVIVYQGDESDISIFHMIIIISSKWKLPWFIWCRVDSITSPTLHLSRHIIVYKGVRRDHDIDQCLAADPWLTGSSGLINYGDQWRFRACGYHQVFINHGMFIDDSFIKMIRKTSVLFLYISIIGRWLYNIQQFSLFLINSKG